jgi:hypothetical protein
VIKVLMPSPCLARTVKRLFFLVTEIIKEPEIPIFLLLIGWVESKKDNISMIVKTVKMPSNGILYYFTLKFSSIRCKLA